MTEVVDCPGFREEILALLLMVLSMLCLLSVLNVGGHHRRTYVPLVAAPVFWFLALAAKEPAVLLVLLFPALLLCSPAGRLAVRRARTSPKAPPLYAAAGMALALIAYGLLHRTYGWHGAAQPWPGGRGPLLGFLNFTRTFTQYTRLAVWPVGLSVGHDFTPSTSCSDPRLWIGLALFSAFALLGFAAFARRTLLGAGAAWTVIAMIPIMQLIPSPELLAERYVYIPMAGAGLMAAALLLEVRRALRRHAPPWLWAVLVALVLALLAWRTVLRNADWSDNITLNMRRYELWQGPQGLLALGSLSAQKHDMPLAAHYLSRAITADPKLAAAHYELGRVFSETGKTSASAACFIRAWELEPDNPDYRSTAARLGVVKP